MTVGVLPIGWEKDEVAGWLSNPPIVRLKERPRSAVRPLLQSLPGR
jgi:hypothetical protein